MKIIGFSNDFPDGRSKKSGVVTAKIGTKLKSKTRSRLVYAAVFLLILAAEIFIALFVRDRFIRPYVGDVLVTVLICAFLRIFFLRARFLPIFVFIFAAAVEVGQYFDMVSLLGLGGIRFFRILIGSTFSIADLICYAVGCAAFVLAERFLVCKK